MQHLYEAARDSQPRTEILRQYRDGHLPWHAQVRLLQYPLSRMRVLALQKHQRLASTNAARYLQAQGMSWELRIMCRPNMGSPLGSAKVFLFQNPPICMCGSSKHVSCLDAPQQEQAADIQSSENTGVYSQALLAAGTCSPIWRAVDLIMFLAGRHAADLGISLRYCMRRQQRAWSDVANQDMGDRI